MPRRVSETPPPLERFEVEATIPRVTAELTEEQAHHPAQLATVQIGAASALTDKKGWAQLTVPAADATQVDVSAGGFLPASAAIP